MDLCAAKHFTARLPRAGTPFRYCRDRYALFLLGVGVWRKSPGLRLLSFPLILLTVGKVFLHDLGALEDLYRVFSLVGLALALIAISLAYQRFVFAPMGEEVPA